MIDAGVRIIDRLIELITVKEKNKEKRFNNLIEPLYRDAEVIVKDYTDLFMGLIKRLESSAEVAEVITWIEDRRMLYLPIRIKVRALLRELDLRHSDSASASPTRGWMAGYWPSSHRGASRPRRRTARPP